MRKLHDLGNGVVSTLEDSAHPLFVPSPLYKPLKFPWAYEAWLTQQRIHWMAEEVNMGLDLQDWNKVLLPHEKLFLTQIFRFFTQMDIGVGNAYLDHYLPLFGPNEIRMMLTSFVAMEMNHQHAYAYLLDSLGIPEIEYQAFLEYKEMRDKWDYMQQFGGTTVHDVALTMAFFSAFTEGLQLFASFAMLMNFQRFNKMKGMGQIVSWSIRDETLHLQSLIRLFRIIVAAHPAVWTLGFRTKIYMTCDHVLEQEDAFVDLAFRVGPIEGMEPGDVKRYVRFIADRRLEQLGLEKRYHILENPFPWMDEINNEYTNFFENRTTEYSKSSTTGSWSDVF